MAADDVLLTPGKIDSPRSSDSTGEPTVSGAFARDELRKRPALTLPSNAVPSSRRGEPTSSGGRRRRGPTACAWPRRTSPLPCPPRTRALRALAVFLAAGAALAASNANAETLPAVTISAVPERVTVLDADTVPGAPRNLAAYAGNASATLTWDAPESPGNTPITKYQYRSGTVMTGDTTLTWGAWTDFSGGDGDTRRGDVSGLTNDTTYTFEVQAVNGAGNGPASNQAEVTPTATAVVNTWELSLSADTIVEAIDTVTATVRIASGPVFDTDQSILLTWGDDREFCYIGPDEDILLAGVPCISGFVRGIGEAGYSKWIVIPAGDRTGSLQLTDPKTRDDARDDFWAFTYDNYLLATLGTTEIGRTLLNWIDLVPQPEATLEASSMEVVEGDSIQMEIRSPTSIRNSTFIRVSVTDDNSVLQRPLPGRQVSALVRRFNLTRTRSVAFTLQSTDSTAVTGAQEVTLELQHNDADDEFYYTLGDSVTLTVLDRDTQANAPQNFTAQPGDLSAALSWDAPAANGAAVEKYRYRQSTDGGTNYGAWTDIPGGTDARAHTVASLTGGIAYTYQMQAHNRAGGGTETEAKTVLTTGVTWGLTLSADTITEGGGTVNADLSINAGATPTQNLTFEVTWAGAIVDADNLVRGANGATTIVVQAGQRSGRLVLRAPDDPEGEGVYRPTATDSVNVTIGGVVVAQDFLTLVDNEPKPEVTIEALKAVYVEGLRVGFRATLSGKISEEVRVTADVADDPVGSLTSATSKDFLFPAGMFADGYVVQTHQDTIQNSLRKLTVTLTLNPDDPHYTLGTPSSATVTVLDDDVAPGVPVNLAAEQGGSDEVILSWDRPADGVVVTHYEYRDSADSADNWGAWTEVPGGRSTRSYTVQGLVVGTEYTFQLSAVNAIGRSAEAGPVSVLVQTVPDPPENLRAESLDGGAKLTWETSGSGGAPILRYDYRRRAESDVNWGAWTAIEGSGPGTTEYTVTSLANFTAHTFEVQAVNRFGRGGESNQATAYPPGLLPSEPENLTAEESSGRAALSWTPPAQINWPSILRYEYRYRTDGATRWHRDWTEIPGGDTLSFVISSLSNGTAYNFEVRAVTVVGAGEAARVTATPQNIGPPGAPGSPSLGSGDGKVVLQWFPPRLDGLRPIMHYEYCLEEIWRCNQEDSLWVEIPESGPGEANDGRYEIARPNRQNAYVRLRAVNDQGAGPSVGRRAVPFPGAPGPPGDFKATQISDDEVRLTWTEPSVGSGVTITGYVIEASPDGLKDWGQRTYNLEVPGPTSYTGEIGMRSRYFRIEALFQVDASLAVSVGGITIYTGISEKSPVAGLIRGPDDPQAQIRVADTYAHEDTDTHMVFTVTIHPALPEGYAASLDWRTEDGTAKQFRDYRPRNGQMLFLAGETEKTVSVPIFDDQVEDSGEFFQLLLSNVHNARLGDEGAAGVIYNHEDVVAGFTLVDAAAGTDVASLADSTEVALDDPANGSYGIVAQAAPRIGSVRLELTGAKSVTRTDNAAPYSLYDDADGTVRGEALPAGSYTLSGTAYTEADGGGDALGTRTVSFTVTARDTTATTGLPVISGTARVGETLTATVDGIEDEDGLENATFAYEWLSNNGTADTDIAGATDSTYTLVPADAGRTIKVRVTFTDDGGAQETRVSAATDPVAVAISSQLSVADAEATEEEDAAVEFVVTLNPAAGDTVTVDYATSDGTATAGEDYTAASGTLTFTAGDTAKTISVPILDDAEDDGGETFMLTLSNASGADLGDAEATGTIRNTETAAELSADFPESAYTSKRHTGSGDRPQVVVAFSEAVASFDKNTPSVTVTGASGLSVQAHTEDGLENAYMFFMTPDGNSDVTFALVADAACASGGICTAGGTVLTQVPAAWTIPGPGADSSSVSVADAEATEEEDGTMDFVVTLDPAASDTVTVDYATSDGTAMAGEDYAATSGTLTFVPDDTTKTISVPITDDTEDDGGETFTLTLSNASGGVQLGDAEATGTILDDDNAPPLTASFSDMPASHTGGEFTFGLAFSEEVEVGYATLRDTAFAVTGGAVKTAQRQQQGSNQAWNITVEPTSANDTVTITLPETTDCDASGAICTGGGRPLSHSLSSVVAGAVSTPAVSVSDASAAEGDTVAFTVSLSAASSQQVTVEYATSDGTATSGTDFTAESGTLTLAANETSKTVSVATTDDSVDEEDETFTLTLSSPANATLGAAAATGTIEDDDEPPPPAVGVSDASAAEGDAVAFTVSLSAASSQQVTVEYATSDGTATSGLRLHGRVRDADVRGERDLEDRERCDDGRLGR